MSENRLRLPPPPLFVIRPPPKPSGSFFDKFISSDLSFDQCLRLKTHFDNISPSISSSNDSSSTNIDWFHLLLRCLALISVIFCLIIAISIFICLKKLRDEEKHYEKCVLSTREIRHQPSEIYSGLNEHCRCSSKREISSSCDDYYSHQLVPINCYSHYSTMMNNNSKKKSSSSSNFHQYESIPEYFLTINRSFHQHRIPYATYSRSIRKEKSSSQFQCSTDLQKSTTNPQEDSSTPLIERENSSQTKTISQWTNL